MRDNLTAVESDERTEPWLTLRDLRILLTAVEAGSMSKAANSLGVSQPAISKTIAQIERVVGAQLITRSSRGIEPTVYGHALLARTRAGFDELTLGLAAMKALADPQSGELRIAANQVALSGIVPKVINRIHASHPGVVFKVIPAYTRADQTRELDQRNVELVVGRMGQVHERLEVSELHADEFVVVAGPGSPWARRRKTELAELMDEPWTFPPLDSVSGKSMAQVFEAAGLGLPRITTFAASIQLHIQLVTRSGVLALLTRSVARSVRGLTELPVVLKGERQSSGILTVRHRTLSPLANLFVHHAHEIVREERLMALPPGEPDGH